MDSPLAPLLLLLLLSPSLPFAFQAPQIPPPISSSPSSFLPRTSTSALSSLPPLHDLSHAHTALSSTSHLLSSAAAAAAASPAAADLGWWGQYIQTFKSGLVLVHDVVDPPLRSLGVTKTWGPSIAVFTAGVRGALVPLSFQQVRGRREGGRRRRGERRERGDKGLRGLSTQ